MATTPTDDLDALLDHVLHHALEQLEAEGDFEPFAAVIDADGELDLVDLEPEGEEREGEEPTPQELVEQLGANLAASAARGEIRASAICANVTLPSEAGASEAALVQLEHREEDPVDIALPYEHHGDHLHTGELVSGVGARRVFP